MLATLIISISLYLSQINSQTQTDICFWGIDQAYFSGATKLNGLYLYAGDYNGVHYYRLDRSGADCATGDYLYFHTINNIWTVTTNPPEGSSSNVYAQCSVISSSPLTCVDTITPGAYWTVYSVQPNAVTIQNTCPEMDCGSISVSATPGIAGNCDSGTFLQTGINEFTKSGTSYVWKFNPLTFNWLCWNTGFDALPGDNGICPDSGFSQQLCNGCGRTLNRTNNGVNGFDAPFSDYTPGAGSSTYSGYTQMFKFTCDSTGAASYTKSPTTPAPIIVPGPTTPEPTYLGTPTTSPITTTSTTQSTTPSTPASTPTVPTTPSVSNTPSPTDDGYRYHIHSFVVFMVLILSISVIIV